VRDKEKKKKEKRLIDSHIAQRVILIKLQDNQLKFSLFFFALFKSMNAFIKGNCFQVNQQTKFKNNKKKKTTTDNCN
jgi:hypothetical protein